MPFRALSLGLSLALLSACGGEETRGAELVSLFTSADQAVLRTRPKLVAGKYAHMAQLAFDFYRGQLAVFRNDWVQNRAGLADTAYENGDAPLVIGDPHPAAESYAVEIAALAAGAPHKRIDASAIGTSPILAGLFSRAMREVRTLCV